MASQAEQIERLVEGFASSGLAVVNEYDASARPVTLTLSDGREFRVFCWNVTTGGRGRSPTEYRIQTTRPGDSPFVVAGAETLVLGYDEDRDIFVAWNAARHPNPSSSASLQVPLETLERAAETGFAARERPLAGDTVEIVTAFRPELVLDYLEVLPGLDVTHPVEATATAEAASGEVHPVEELPGDVERKRTISTVSRAVRNAQFRSSVLRAYDHRCALCGLGAGLVQAAHIHSVAGGGVDQVRNGIAACPTHHACLDLGLIVIGTDYSIVLNKARLVELGASEDDIDVLEESLFEQLRLPAQEDLGPAPENIEAHRSLWLTD
jgi:putative restriction endonuclease